MLLGLVLSLALAVQTENAPSGDELVAEGARLIEENRLTEAEAVLRRAADAEPKASAPHVLLARLYLLQNQPQLALERADRALGLDRGDSLASFLRGEALMQLGRFDEALLELAAALEKNPDDVGSRKAYALASLRANEPARAVDALRPLVEEDPGGGEDPAALAMYGASLAELGRDEEAIPPLEKALRAEPGQPQALFFLAKALLATGRYRAAADRFQEGLSFPPPQNIRFILGLAEARLELEERDEARRLLEALLLRHPRVARAWYLRGLIDAELGSYADAQSHFQKALEHGHGTADTYLNLGIALASLEDSEAALESIERALELNPALAAAHYYKGLLLFHRGDMLAAVESLERAASIEPEEARTFLALAEVYMSLHRVPQALEAAEKASQSEALAARALYWKGLAHHESIEYLEAEEAYRASIAQGLDTAAVHLNLARALYAMAKHPEALDAVNQALERTPEAGEAHLLKGKILMEQREYETALAHLERATTTMPENADAWYRKGVVESRQNHYQQAIADWRKALELDPELLDVYYRLGNALVRTGKAEEGEKLLSEFQRRSTEADQKEHQTAQVRTTIRRGIELADQGRDAEALENFHQAMEIDPENPLGYLHLAEFLAVRGRVPEAERVLRDGLNRLPTHLSLHEALLSLYLGSGNRAGAEAQRRRIEELEQDSGVH